MVLATELDDALADGKILVTNSTLWLVRHVLRRQADGRQSIEHCIRSTFATHSTTAMLRRERQITVKIEASLILASEPIIVVLIDLLVFVVFVVIIVILIVPILVVQWSRHSVRHKFDKRARA